MRYLYKLLRFALLSVFLFTGSTPLSYSQQASQQPQLVDWQKSFLEAVERHYKSRSHARDPSFEHYAHPLKGFGPEELLKVVEQRVALRPYRGSMVEPKAVLMGGSGNSLDRARLLAALLEYTGHTARVVQSSSAKVSYPATTPPSLEMAQSDVLVDLEKLTQRDGPKLYRRLCRSEQSCQDWPQQPSSQRQAFWVQFNSSQGWQDLVPGDTVADAQARSAAKVLSQTALKDLSWSIRIEVSNTYGNSSPKRILQVEMPAARLSAKAITFDNLPQSNGFTPVLSIAGESPRSGEFFTLGGSGGALNYQQLAIEVRGPGVSRRHTRLLAVPNPKTPGLEMVTRARITLSTGPLWTEQNEYLQTRTLDRLGNMLYAPENERDPSPTNFNSFRALSFLSLSRRYAGQVGQAGRQTHVYQGSPTIIVERLTAYEEGEFQALHSNFDLVDMGNAVYCENCSLEQRRQAAVEQGLVDGYLEDQLLISYQGTSSHRLTSRLISSGGGLKHRVPQNALWEDKYNDKSAGYRLATVDKQVVGWRLSPGPQITPLLESGTGGASGQILASVVPSSSGARAGGSSLMPSGGRVYNPFSGGVSGFVTNMIRHATTKCGASDIGGSIFLAVAGAPMTAPLLSGIVGHMCRTAEAYNKASMALNCLEFMGNDCSAEKQASDLERMLRGLGPELAIDLALAQAMDILFGMAIDGAIAPALRNWFKKWRNKTPRQRARARGEDIGTDGVSRPIGDGPTPGRLPDTDGTGAGAGRAANGEDAGSGMGRTPDGDEASKGKTIKYAEDTGPVKVEEFTMDDLGSGTGRKTEGEDTGSGTGRKTDGEDTDSGTGRKTDGEEGSGGKKTDEPSSEVDKQLQELEKDVGKLTYDEPKPVKKTQAENTIKIGDRAIMKQPGLSPQHVKAIEDGQIPVEKGDTWNGVLQYGRIADGPSNLGLDGRRFHKDMGIVPQTPNASRQGFTVSRDPVTGKIHVSGSGSQQNKLSTNDEAAIRRMVQQWIDQSGT